MTHDSRHFTLVGIRAFLRHTCSYVTGAILIRPYEAQGSLECQQPRYLGFSLVIRLGEEAFSLLNLSARVR